MSAKVGKWETKEGDTYMISFAVNNVGVVDDAYVGHGH